VRHFVAIFPERRKFVHNLIFFTRPTFSPSAHMHSNHLPRGKEVERRQIDRAEVGHGKMKGAMNRRTKDHYSRTMETSHLRILIIAALAGAVTLTGAHSQTTTPDSVQTRIGAGTRM
jgi:hypothetical protein